MKKISCLALLFLFFTTTAFAGTVNLPKTGQTQCYDTSGTGIPCAGTGQDGEIQAGVVWPEPRFTDNHDDTMTDNLTGLMWTKDANLAGDLTWQEALDYCNNLTLAGYPDWCLPNINELESLLNANEADIATWLTNQQHFTDVQDSYYWSSTGAADYPGFAWIVDMRDGAIETSGKSFNYHYLWPVRAGQSGLPQNSVVSLPKTGQTKCYDTYGTDISCSGTGQDGEIQAGVEWPSPRFTDHGDGTVTDSLTGLMWTKDANLAGATTWQGALDYVISFNTSQSLKYKDWRLPNRKELNSLRDFSQYDPAIPAGYPFTNVKTQYYWSSTTYAYSPDNAWLVDMWIGDAIAGNKTGAYDYYVWPVRDVSCSKWNDVIEKYTAYVNGQAVWTEVITCYTEYVSHQ